jgi:protein SCO1/2
LFCTVYDPNSDRYRFDYSIFTAIVVGLLSLGLIAAFIIREWQRAR